MKYLNLILLTICFFSYAAATEHKVIPLMSAETHTMEGALYGYMDLKVHEWIREREYETIVVVGEYDRSKGISKNEKGGKLFNWQRPTAEVKGNTLIIKCYPGREYVKHYATLIATYLALHNKKWSHVRYRLPDELASWELLTKSNLMEVPKGDLVVMGYGLESLADVSERDWKGEGAFSWVQRQVGDKKVIYLGCRHSYWGDTAEKIVKVLADRGFQRILYVGKVGGLNRQGVPNETLATGSASYVEGEIVHWHNVFDFAQADKSIVFGDNYTIPSVLHETKEWWHKSNPYAFVDNEIGYMARAAVSEKIEFSYLHIISDNLNATYGETLVNERAELVKKKRALLLRKVKDLIKESIVQRPLLREGRRH